ncbi:hypothetical protein DEAB109302_11135 [Dermacoccus abyssi]
MKSTASLAVLGVAAALVVSGCQNSKEDAATTSTSSSSTSSEVTISDTPQSKWPTTPPGSTSTSSSSSSSSSSTSGTTSASSASSVKPTSPREIAKAAEPTAKKFMTAFFATDGVSQDAWAKKVSAYTDEAFGARLSGEGLERLPHGEKVTGSARLLWVSEQDPTAQYFVPTSNGGYTVTMQLTTNAGEVTNLAMGNTDEIGD